MAFEKRKYTEEQLEWFRKNYPTQTYKYIRLTLHMGIDTIKRLAKEMNLVKVEEEKAAPPPKPKYFYDEGCICFCQDCLYYVANGRCEKSGKEIGALWQKKCFKTKTKNT